MLFRSPEQVRERLSPGAKGQPRLSTTSLLCSPRQCRRSGEQRKKRLLLRLPLRAARGMGPTLPLAQAAAPPQYAGGPRAGRPEAGEVKAICPVWDLLLPSLRPLALRLPRVPAASSILRRQAARAGGGVSRAPPPGLTGRCQGAGLCAFLILRENRTRGPQMRSLTMAVPTEKVAIRQAMPRGRRRRGRGCRRRGRAAGTRLRSHRLGSCAPRGLGLRLYSPGAPAPPTTRPLRPRPLPAHTAPPSTSDWPAPGGGAEPTGARALVLLLRGRGWPSSLHTRSSGCPSPWPGRWVPRILRGPRVFEFRNSRGLGQSPWAPDCQRGVPVRTSASVCRVWGEGRFVLGGRVEG